MSFSLKLCFFLLIKFLSIKFSVFNCNCIAVITPQCNALFYFGLSDLLLIL